MSRRSFLAILAAGMALDTDKLLWKPGAKFISIPKPVKILDPWRGIDVIHLSRMDVIYLSWMKDLEMQTAYEYDQRRALALTHFRHPWSPAYD